MRKSLFGVRGLSQTQAISWDQAVLDFQMKRDELNAAESALYDVYPKLETVEDIAEHRATLDKVIAAAAAMDNVGSIGSTITGAWDYVKNTFGLSGAGLGMLPAVPLVTLLGLIAGATAAISAAYGFISYINVKTGTAQQLINNGVDPVEAHREAQRIAEAESGYSVGAHISNTVKWAAVALVAAFILPKVWK